MTKTVSVNDEVASYLEEFGVTDLSVYERSRKATIEEFREASVLQITPEQADFLKLLINIGGYRNILELGTFTGYSALSMALAMGKGGRVFTVDKCLRATSVARKLWGHYPIGANIELMISDAMDALEGLISKKKEFDFIFIDADKINYINYYQLCSKLLSKKGVMVFDNVLWRGDVADSSKRKKYVQQIHSFNQFVKQDGRFTTSIFSVGDGMMVCQSA